MKLSNKLTFYKEVRKDNGLVDTLNFLFLKELGLGRYKLPELCKHLELTHTNFNASLLRLKKNNMIEYIGLKAGGIVLWWIKKDKDDKPNHEIDAPRWIIYDKDKKNYEFILLGKEEIWALNNNINPSTLKLFLLGRTKLLAEKYSLTQDPLQNF